MLENSRAKLQKKNLDMIAANNLKVAGAGFGVETNVLTLITPDSELELPIMSKDAAADALLDEITKRLPDTPRTRILSTEAIFVAPRLTPVTSLPPPASARWGRPPRFH